MYFQMIYKYCSFINVISIFVKVKIKKVMNVSNHYQRNKLGVAKRLCTGEAQVVPFFDTNTCVVSPHSSDINVCKHDLSAFVIKYILFDKENFIFLVSNYRAQNEDANDH